MNSDEKKAFEHLHAECERIVKSHDELRTKNIELETENVALKAQVKDLSEKLAVVAPVDDSAEVIAEVNELADELADEIDAELDPKSPAAEPAHDEPEPAKAEEPAPAAPAEPVTTEPAAS